MVKPAQFSKIAMAALVGSAVIFSHTQPADAAWLRKDDFLGQLTTTDNTAYWRAQRRLVVPTPPDRNTLCQWKYGNNNVWGQAASWWGADNWKTNCYRWRWFWQ
jgi:hypothetical protein